MALDFPSNPVDGQVYDNFYYDASMGSWRAYGVENLKIPAGIISQYAGSTAPSGYLMCTGQSLLVAEYPALHAAIGYQYGGSGLSFNIPNLQDRVPVGKGTETEFDTLGETGGSKAVSLTVGQLPSHTHTTPDHSHSFSATTSSNGNHAHSPSGSNVDGFVAHMTALDGSQAAGIPTTINGYIVSTRNTNTTGAHTHTVSGTTGTANPATNSAGSGESHSNLQPYIVLNYIIKT